VSVATNAPRWLGEPGWRRLRDRAQSAVQAARRHGHAGTLISVSERLDGAVDPSPVVIGSRRPDEHWFCLEQPDRDGTALAALGCVHEVGAGASGHRRFEAVDRRWRELVSRALADPPAGPPGSGLIAAGAFAFAAAGGASPTWRGFEAGSLIVPELSLARRAGETWLTLNVMPEADDTVEGVLARVERRLAELRSRPLPLLDPAPTGHFVVHSPMPPSHYEEAVARAVQRIQAGELEKIVLAREVQVTAPTAHDPGAVYEVLRTGFPSCFVYALGRGRATFVGASPELLVRRDGQRASTVALAGSTRRSADPALDDHLGESLVHSEKDRHEVAIVARRIARALAPYSVWVTAAPEPALVRVANIQHLATPIRAQLARPVGAVALAGGLHPTPAVGGEPFSAADPLIPALEGLDRGWYAGPVGWTDLTGDGEFCVALRCALLRGLTATCYAGCGIVAGSDPASELAETEVKLAAMLPVLSGLR
jgi:salicylate biosynthesis isochorismate synthase/menaquinone-specific isochorismate synthase